jgi:hypothetical protein
MLMAYEEEVRLVLFVLADATSLNDNSFDVLLDIVLITNAPTGAVFPLVTRIGEPEDFPRGDRLRAEVWAILLGLFAGAWLNTHQPSRIQMLSTYVKDAGDYVVAHGQEPPVRRPLTGSALSQINWYGEVRDLRLDGQVDVVLPDKTTVTVRLDRLVVFDDLLGDEHLGPGEEYDDDGDVRMDGSAGDEGDAGSDASWETDEGPDEWIDVGTTDEPEVKVDEIRLNDKQPSAEDDVAQPVVASGTAQIGNVEMVDVEVPGGSLAVAKGKDEEDGPWKRFEILEEAPAVSVPTSCDALACG